MDVYEEGADFPLRVQSRCVYGALPGWHVEQVRPSPVNREELGGVRRQDLQPKKNGEVATKFKSTFTRKCPVYFIGVWDTVGSLTMNAGSRFHDAKLNKDVKYGYHAMAIDEVRKDFPVSLWDESKVKAPQVVEQVWFAGVHCNVGGWYDDRGLSNIALKWMMLKAKDCGFEIDEAALAKKTTNPNGKLEDSHAGFWFFRGKNVREIAPGSKVHSSVVQRKEERSNDYDPDNLPNRFKEVE